MKTKAVRLYGAEDLRLEEFELPEIKADEILAEVFTDSLCMSTYKAVKQGENHAKVPKDIATHPVLVGHEFCGRLLAIGEKWENEYQVGDRFVIQPNIGAAGGAAPGYSYRFIGGDATKIVIPCAVMESGSLMIYQGDTFFEGSLVEPLSCVVGAFNANYHLEKRYSHQHVMGIKQAGNMAILGATGPMGFLAIDLAVHGPRKPKRLVVTGRTQSKLDWAQSLYPVEEAKAQGVELHYVNTKTMPDFAKYLRELTGSAQGFDDVFIFAPVKELVTQGEQMLVFDGCLNIFSGPTDPNFAAELNVYNVHYKATHIVGTSGGNTDDMREAIRLIESKSIKPAKIVSHILGINAAIDTTLQLPNLSGGKKIVYTHHDMRLSAISELKNDTDPFVQALNKIVTRNGGHWCKEAENYLMVNGKKI